MGDPETMTENTSAGSVDLQYAGLGQRLIAALFDFLLILCSISADLKGISHAL
jgi:hypothetical protein